MIRVIIGYKVRENADLQPTLLKLRSHAMTYPGFVAAENLQNVRDISIIAMVQTWDRIEDWQAWETSRIRRSILLEAKPLLQDDPRITVYQVMPTPGWAYASKGS